MTNQQINYLVEVSRLRGFFHISFVTEDKSSNMMPEVSILRHVFHGLRGFIKSPTPSMRTYKMPIGIFRSVHVGFVTKEMSGNMSPEVGVLWHVFHVGFVTEDKSSNMMPEVSVFRLVFSHHWGVFNFFLGEVLSADCTQEQNCNKKILHLNGQENL